MSVSATSDDDVAAYLTSGGAAFDRSSTPEWIADTLRTAITEGHCRPGSRLREERIAGALGVSRNSVREAFRLLVHERLLAYELNKLPVLGLPGSAVLRLASGAGLSTVEEAFADRAYTPDARLVPRTVAGSVLHDADLVCRRTVAIATGQPIAAIDGSTVAVGARSICVHGDTPGAATLAARVRAALTGAGVALEPFA